MAGEISGFPESACSKVLRKSSNSCRSEPLDSSSYCDSPAFDHVLRKRGRVYFTQMNCRAHARRREGEPKITVMTLITSVAEPPLEDDSMQSSHCGLPRAANRYTSRGRRAEVGATICDQPISQELEANKTATVPVARFAIVAATAPARGLFVDRDEEMAEMLGTKHLVKRAGFRMLQRLQ